MRILITGAAGFIGAQTVRACVAREHEVIALVRPGASIARLDGIEGSATVIRADLNDQGAIRRVTEDLEADAIVHLAWYAEPGRYLDDVPQNLASLQATINLLQAASAHGCRRVVLAGTCLELADGPARSIYQASKRAAHAVMEGLQAPQLSLACGHVFHLFGPGEDSRRVVPTVIRGLLRGEPVPTTDGAQPRDYLHVADVAAAFCLLAESSVRGGIDICSGETVRLRDVFAMIGDEIGQPSLIRIGALGPAIGDGQPATGDTVPMRDIGWQPAHDLRGGIADSIAWWRTEGNRS